MKEQITLDKIREIKEKAEDYIGEIIIKLEKETGCLVQDINMFVNTEEEEERESLEIDLNLRLPFRVFKK